MAYFNNCRNAAELKTAFYKLAKQFHPDVNQDPAAEAIMQRITSEYNALKENIRNQQSVQQPFQSAPQPPRVTFVKVTVFAFTGMKIGQYMAMYDQAHAVYRVTTKEGKYLVFYEGTFKQINAAKPSFANKMQLGWI